MRPIAIGMCCLLGAALAAAQPAATERQATDVQSVRDLVARYVAARDLRDPAAVAALFTPDADQYTTSGEWRRGQAAIVSGTARSSRQNPGERRIRVEAVRFLTPDVAMADGPYEIVAGGPEATTRQMWTSIVAVRRAEGWRIAAIRNMRPTGTPPPR
jgi:uncharacterized protein (TIGR02246 family)